MSGNPYQPPIQQSSRIALYWARYWRSSLCIIGWLPASLLIGVATPLLFGVFADIERRGALPLSGHWLIQAAKANQSLCHLPLAFVLVGLVTCDVLVARFSQRRRVLWLSRFLEISIVIIGLTAAVLILVVLLQSLTGTYL
jgi:hypothetical protein